MKKIFLTLSVALMALSLNACSSGDDEPMPDTPTQNPDNGNNGENNGDNSGNSGDNNGDNSGNTNPQPATKVIFEDDFEGESGNPDPSKWVLCQKSTSDWARYLSESYDQAYIENGVLNLVGERTADGQYLTGGIETRGKFDFQYGTVECRARVYRHPKGSHTGIWMMPAPPAEQWPKSGEIDIMEHLNDDSFVYETVHSWYLDDLDKTDPKGRDTAPINLDDWNTYGVIWTADSITFTVNGQEYLSYPNLKLDNSDAQWQWPFSHPFYIILSQSLGGEGTWAGPIDNEGLPAIFQIDWIKVTQTE